MKLNVLICFAGLIVSTAMAGCASWGTGPSNTTVPHTQNAAYPNSPATPQTHALGLHPGAKGLNAHNYQNGYTSNGFNQNLTEQLTKAADDVPGVDRATVAVSGTDAVIGIRIRSNLGEPQVRVIEQQVHAAARSVAPTYHIRVSSDFTMFNRIRAINADIYHESTNRPATNKVTNTSTEFRELLHDMGTIGITPTH
ncbi:YhcN/YlaJ family sporulation lipoprotein [uncultured Brevibacillus sp.]|uniref:YhcN/YlaJ family sporulation lipoprotein n=1 Tax=uncultured Brevibacillus sp. TaxID=169970 RepID=UPI0025936114|nr:YhcN/YlaJ family sporulation lipoprotein [uncultured Brevibacillus sp.]